MTLSMQLSANAAGFASVVRNGFPPFPAAASVPQAFAHAVRAFPDRRALVDGERSWTYAQLDRLSDLAASTLCAKGVVRGQGVGIYMDRSAEAVVAMLAILKLGAMYVPFDPAAPDERLASQARGAMVRVLAIASGSASPSWFKDAVAEIGVQAGEASGVLPQPDIHPLELAYVIHTSGSTNEAKGVCVTHRAILDLVAGAAYCSFVPEDVVYHGMSIAFDGSTFEIWGALLSGACLVVAPPAVSIQGIVELVEAQAISVLLLSTGLFNALGREALQRLARVRVLLAGGDVMSPHSASQFLAGGGRMLVNGYGPTEVTTFSHCHVMTARPEPAAAVPIGTPINGTAAYVLDEHGAALPVGAEGELFVAGTGLAQGYLGNPALTAERFVPDPFATDGSRMYRTGDLVRQAPDGALDYIGRIDTQVKIRGFRVELGEIETCLRRAGGLDDACVIHLKSAAGSSVLFAYGVPRPGAPVPSEGPLLEQMRDLLPDYMLPRRVLFIEALPLTINGKVDRRELTARAAALLGQAGPALPSGEEPGDPLTRSLMLALGDLLGRSLAPTDNFFDAGGDSLTAMRFCAQVSEEHDIHLPLVALFEADSLGQLVEHIRGLKAARPVAEEQADAL
ncbi:MAG TPA: non-ribosomal peptide synthetase [Frateuria sp.]|uniref:non-ribosomal peptide synthetase n=1 Tax=Frateuria sp. TaxID=2211372 RepID=UPI002D8014BC|nr:non-ribosomal peptide synthetase [Frateuria sp.]HET6805637.1 non-ribosomal peptide synthetase [Frateuria sp.]